MAKATWWVRDNAGLLLMVCLLTWGGLGVTAAMWALDDSPPITLTRYTVTPVQPGGTMLVIADVQRDTHRNCTATYSRRFVDSRGAIHALEGDTTMSAAGIRDMDKRSPGKLIFTVPTRWDTPPGKGLIVTPLSYNCNPWQSWRPLTMTLEMQAEVLAP